MPYSKQENGLRWRSSPIDYGGARLWMLISEFQVKIHALLDGSADFLFFWLSFLGPGDQDIFARGKTMQNVSAFGVRGCEITCVFQRNGYAFEWVAAFAGPHSAAQEGQLVSRIFRI